MSDSLILSYNPDASGQSNYLKEAGKYGEGMDNPAVVTIGKVSIVDKTRDSLPDFMKNDPLDFVDVRFDVVSERDGKCFVNNSYRAGKELNEFLTTMGADSVQQITDTVDDKGRPTKEATLDLAQLVGLKVACIEVKAPRKDDKGIWRSGYVVKVYGA